MKRVVLYSLMVCLVSSAVALAGNPRVAIETTVGGPIVIELYPDEAPKTVENFLKHVESGFYVGTMFHRVIRDFMIQGGGFGSGGQLKPTEVRLDNEADNGLKNLRSTVAMARKADPHSASVQFYINHAHNSFLDHKAKTPRGWGYAVFGKVVEGMEVVDEIAGVQVRRSRLSEAQPLEDVLITKATVIAPVATSSSSGE